MNPEGRDTAPRRRRPLLALVIIVMLAVLVSVVAVVIDNAVRAYAEDRVRSEIRTALALPTDAPLDVTIGGFSMLRQLATGSIERVDVDSESVTFGELTGPVHVTATGVPLDTAQPMDELDVRFAASEESLTSISANLSGLPITAVAIEGDQIDIAAEFEVLFIAVPLGVGLSPTTVDGEIAFTPTSIRVGDAAFDADGLRSRFGAVAGTALQTRNLCVAEYVPQALVLDSVQLDDSEMVLRFGARDVVLDGPELSTMGTCP